MTGLNWQTALASPYACLIADSADHQAWFAGEAERCVGQTIASGTNPALRYITIKQPIGPVALLVPWNFPFALAARKIATALAAGCTSVMKPSPESPFTGLILGPSAR